ncbi:MAG TPA: GNAT family N-acetyltransferase [Candidatus Thermoplasmatota archaeon]|nr:GNAT family N-acetyltransferase [Candidatus Thermoplasmatota archaeon]
MTDKGETMKAAIREATKHDLKEIVEIFNQAIRTRSSVGYTSEVTVEDRKEWFQEHLSERYPIYVAELNHELVAWMSINPYRKGRPAFQTTGEVDCFIREGWQGKGLGNELMPYLLRQAKTLGFHTIIAIVLEHNAPSRRLLEKHGFQQWGFLPGIGEIDGKDVGHVYYGKRLL